MWPSVQHLACYYLKQNKSLCGLSSTPKQLASGYKYIVAYKLIVIVVVASGGFRAGRLPRQATRAALAKLIGLEKSGPSPNRQALDWSVVGRFCPIIPQDK